MKYFLTLLGVAALFVMIFAFKSCEDNFDFQIGHLRVINFSTEQKKGDGDVVEEVRQVANFSEISVRNAIELVLKQADEEKIVVKTDQNLQDDVKTEVKNGKLNIYTKGTCQFTKMTVYVTFKDLKKLKASGATKVAGKEITLNDFEMRVSGASEIKLFNFKAKSIDVVASGASDLAMSGECDELDVKGSGAADTKLYDLSAQRVNVKASGAADVKVTAVKSLKAVASGAADITYDGNPENITTEDSGGSDVSKR